MVSQKSAKPSIKWSKQRLLANMALKTTAKGQRLRGASLRILAQDCGIKGKGTAHFSSVSHRRLIGEKWRGGAGQLHPLHPRSCQSVKLSTSETAVPKGFNPHWLFLIVLYCKVKVKYPYIFLLYISSYTLPCQNEMTALDCLRKMTWGVFASH